MKETPKNTQGNLRMASWLSVQTIAIIGITILSFIVVELLADHLWGPRETGNLFILVLLLFLPLSLLMGILNYRMAKGAFSHIQTLGNAMEKAALGHFETRLDTYHANTMGPVYMHFNAMCEELQQVQQLRSDFTNQYSHEFKTPIVSIKGFAELLLSTSLPAAEQRIYLNIIREESTRLANLADNTILLSKLDSTAILRDQKDFSLDEQLRDCIVALSKQWGAQQIRLTAHLDPVSFCGNADFMRQIWLNLIGNAIKFTPKGGSVTVSMTSIPGEILVTVTDTGIGMTKEQAAHIFDEYYQGETGISRQGLGLGLSIAQRIVGLCGGEIFVESTPGKGSRFAVRLPTLPT